MFSPDCADKDPRNPANQAEPEGREVFYICPNQFDGNEPIDACIDAWLVDGEVDAMQQAKRIATMVGHRVLVQRHFEADGEREHLSTSTVFPWSN